MKLEMYDKLSYPEYMATRKAEKAKNSKAPVATELENQQLDTVWKQLLGDPEYEGSAFQLFHRHSYNPYPNPREEDSEEARVLVEQSHRRFIQYLNPTAVQESRLMHLDLNSAYITALANVKHSLKFRYRLNIDSLDEIVLNRDYEGNNNYSFVGEKDRFRIIRMNIKMPYDPLLHLFTPNNKIKHNGKSIGHTTFIRPGEVVEARVELFVGEKYNIDALSTWLKLLSHKEIVYTSISIWVYEYKERDQMYTFETVRKLLESMVKMDKDTRAATKRAMVIFAGQMTNIDSGRRLIMLASAEEIVRRLYVAISAHTNVMGVQIDGIYYEPFDAPFSLVDIAHYIGKEVYGIDDPKYLPRHFAKNELWSGYGKKPDFKVTNGRIQEV